jgi:hypothetical protein
MTGLGEKGAVIRTDRGADRKRSRERMPFREFDPAAGRFSYNTPAGAASRRPPALTGGHVTRTAVEEETERFRQLVIAARSTTKVRGPADACIANLNTLFKHDKSLFSVEDIRWLNVLRGYLGLRLAAHEPAVPHTKKAKRKGDQLDHCWRCETPVDERFTALCPACDSASYHWRVCPVCQACGCQRAGDVVV